MNYIKWGFESRLKPDSMQHIQYLDYIKWGFESRLKPHVFIYREKTLLYQMGI